MCHERIQPLLPQTIFIAWMKDVNSKEPQQILKCWECTHEIDVTQVTFHQVLTRALKMEYFDKSPSSPLIVLNKRCIFPPRGYRKFKYRGLCLMTIYSKVKLYNIYTNLSEEDKKSI